MSALFFDDAEARLFQRVLLAIRSHNPEDAATLKCRIDNLGRLNDLVLSLPSLSSAQSLVGDVRTEESLIEHLLQHDGLCGELDLPLKSSMQRTFLLAKIQCLRALVSATHALALGNPDLDKLNIEVRGELAQSVYTQMAEEIFLAILRKPEVRREIKHRSATQLIAIWDNTQIEIDDFCPMLESAWKARNRMIPELGSLLGAAEYFRLATEECSPLFLDFFSRHEVSESENQAFSEFLFGMTWEELETLKLEMKRQALSVVDEAWAQDTLGRPLEHDCELDNPNHIDPISMYRSYQRRQLAADYRIISQTPGPSRTAEAYLLIYWLEEQS